MPRSSTPPIGVLTDTWGRRNRKHADRPCNNCGVVYRPDRPTSKYCSRPCAWANNGGVLGSKWISKKPTEERFWSFVNKNGPVVSLELGACWIWTGHLDVNGYGRFRPDRNGSSIGSHKFAWEQANGPFPEGLEPDHLCRLRSCVNPAHLEPVTHRINMLRGNTIIAKNSAKTTCFLGHPFDDANTRIDSQGARLCRICEKTRSAKYRRYRPSRAKVAAV